MEGRPEDDSLKVHLQRAEGAGAGGVHLDDGLKDHLDDDLGVHLDDVLEVRLDDDLGVHLDDDLKVRLGDGLEGEGA